MASRSDWLDAGLDILAADGAPALTIERLTERLGLTKGSFYHHFGGMAGFKTALLAHYETHHTTRLIEETEADPGADKLASLTELVLRQGVSTGPAVAMRAWAQQDEEVRQVQERVDRTRVDYLRTLMRESHRDPAVGHLVYLVFIGASHIVPPLSEKELRAMWELILKANP